MTTMTTKVDFKSDFKYISIDNMAWWLSGRVLAQGLRGLQFKPLPLHTVVEVSFSLTYI